MTRTLKRAMRTLPLLALLLTTGLSFIPVSATSPTCTSAGSTGLTAALVATSGQYITGNVNASGCDVGIFIGPGLVGVTVANATVTGANDHGIFAQDSSHLIIYGNTVEGNGVSPNTCPVGAPPAGPCIDENKAIELSGVSWSTVAANTVKNNHADGGIGISDDGLVDPGALSGHPGTSSPGEWNVVIDNTIINNTAGCGIVLHSGNPSGVLNNQVLENTVVGTSLVTFNPHDGPPFVGAIVVAGVLAENNIIFGNKITGSMIPGITIHSSEAGGLIKGTIIWDNTISSNGVEMRPGDSRAPTGIDIVAHVIKGASTQPAIEGTSVIMNTVNSDAIGLWTCNAPGTIVFGLSGSAAMMIASC